MTQASHIACSQDSTCSGFPRWQNEESVVSLEMPPHHALKLHVCLVNLCGLLEAKIDCQKEGLELNFYLLTHIQGDRIRIEDFVQRGPAMIFLDVFRIKGASNP